MLSISRPQVASLTGDSREIPEGWKLFVHPRGWIYFSNPSLKLITDQDIRDPELFNLLNARATEMTPSDWPQGAELLLQVNNLGEIDYLLAVNHSLCVASTMSVDDITDEAVQALDVYTVNRLRRVYWNYLNGHPSHAPCPTRAVSDASDALNWFYTDNLVSGARCNAPFSKTECEELMKVVKDMQLAPSENSAAKVVFLSWLLREVCSYRNAESYGLHTRGSDPHKARMSASTSRDNHFETKNISPLLVPALYFITNFFFFGIPWSYLAHVKASLKYQGRFVNLRASWSDYVERLVREYSHFLLVSTVLLSATVGVLAIPEISPGVRAAATVSAFFALGSVIVSVFSIWRHQSTMLPSDLFTYTRNANQHMLGLQGHAMLLSVPPVLLIWAIITFTVSIVAYTTQEVDSTSTFGRRITYVVLGLFVIILGTVMIALHNTFSLMWHMKYSIGQSWWGYVRRAHSLIRRQRTSKIVYSL